MVSLILGVVAMAMVMIFVVMVVVVNVVKGSGVGRTSLGMLWRRCGLG